MYVGTEQRSRERIHVLAEELYRERYHYLVQIANRNAANCHDASEAVQFAFAAFIEKYNLDSGSPPLGWLTLTLQRRCWALRRVWHLDRSAGQEAGQGEGPGAVIDALPSRTSGPEQLVEQVDEARERLGALKPAERRVLVLIAAGYSYREVGQITGFSYTKTNRSAAEGRARLRELAPARR